MEFEALTGMSMIAVPAAAAGAVQHSSRASLFPSAVQWFKRAATRPSRSTPSTTEMYRRRDVYRTFGFDDFLYDRARCTTGSRLGHDVHLGRRRRSGVQRQIEAEATRCS